MAKTPIEMMFDGVQWTERPAPDGDLSHGIPYATHSGILTIAPGCELECSRLSDGRSVISEAGMMMFFRWLASGGNPSNDLDAQVEGFGVDV